MSEKKGLDLLKKEVTVADLEKRVVDLELLLSALELQFRILVKAIRESGQFIDTSKRG